jgi:hypothetical protein
MRLKRGRYRDHSEIIANKCGGDKMGRRDRICGGGRAEDVMFAYD